MFAGKISYCAYKLWTDRDLAAGPEDVSAMKPFQQNTLKNLPRLVILVVIALMMDCLSLLAQFQYSGAYRLGSLRGMGEFSYLLKGRDTIFQGPFELEHGSLEEPAGSEGYFLVKGAYSEDVPTGEWMLRFGQFSPTGSISLDDYRYEVRLNGVLHQVGGEILNGQYQGKWIHQVQEIQNSEPGRQLFRSEVQFEAGIAQLAVQMEKLDQVLLGRFLRNGLAHDVWSLYANQKQVEHWHFKEGLLERIVLSPGKTGSEFSVFSNVPESLKIINLDARYIALLEAYLKVYNRNYEIKGSTIANLILDNSGYYTDVDEVLRHRRQYAHPIPFQVKVPYQPMLSNQLKDLEQIRASLAQIDSLSEIARSSSSVNIAKTIDDDVSYWQATIESLSSEFLRPVRTLIEYDDQEILDFIPKAPLWEFLWPKGSVTEDLAIKYEVHGNERTRPYAIALPPISEPKPGPISSIVQMTNSILVQIDSISGLLQSRARPTEGGDRLAAAEKQIIDITRSIDSLLDSSKVVGAAHQALVGIQSQARQEVLKYSTLTDIDDKEVQVLATLTCLIDMKDLAQQINLIPIRWQLIQTAYTDQVWNNFTSTVMSEEVKKRITRSFRDVIVPYLLERVANDLSCENAEPLAKSFRQSYEKMHELRLKETTKLERKLKKANDPKIIMTLLDLDSVDMVKS